MPPGRNPIPSKPPTCKVWAEPTEIVPGYWLVKEMVGPMAREGRYAVVLATNTLTGWTYVGYVSRPRYDWCELKLHGLSTRRWEIRAHKDHRGWLIQELIRLVKEFA